MGVYQECANHPPRDRSQNGKDQYESRVEETGIMKRRGISRQKVALSLDLEFVNAIGTLHDTVFRKRLRQRLVQFHQKMVAWRRSETCRHSHV